MQNIVANRSVAWTFDSPVFVTYDSYGKTRKFEVVGAKYIESTVGKDSVLFSGYELTATGKRRKNSYPSYIHMQEETGMTGPDGSWIYIATAAGPLKAQCRKVGEELVNRYYKVVSN